jgi:hypothetical protein
VNKIKLDETGSYQEHVVAQKTNTQAEQLYGLKYNQQNNNQGIIFSSKNLYAGEISKEIAYGQGIETFKSKGFYSD